MYVRRSFEFRRIWPITTVILLSSGAYAGVICALFVFQGMDWLRVPALPVTVMGTAVSFYLGFKGNAAYDRVWEARKIWGGIVNTSRTWGAHVTAFVNHDFVEGEKREDLAALHEELVYRHVAWLGSLRTQLRRRKSWENDQPRMKAYREKFGTHDTSPEMLRSRIEPFLDAEEVEWVMARQNQSTQLLHRQSTRLAELKSAGLLDDFRHMELAEAIETLYTLQGKCERIKNFPLPRQYSTVNHWFVTLFLLGVPLALTNSFAAQSSSAIWWTIPTTMVLSWIFSIWNSVIDYTENPFEGLINDIPIDALARTIEIDLREMLGEVNLPAKITPTDDVLM